MSYRAKRSYGAISDGPAGMSAKRYVGGRMLRYTPSAPLAGSYRSRNRAPKYIKGAIAPFGGRQELKYVDVAEASYACSTTGSVTCLNLLAVGDDNTTRDGRQVCIKSVQLRGIVNPASPACNVTNARVMLVWDNAANSGTIATIAMILAASTSNSFPLIDNAQRFTVLMDRTFAIGQVSNTATQSYAWGPATYNIDFYKKMNSVTQYSGTTAAIGSIQNGALLLVTIGDQVAGVAAVAKIASRVRFTDS